MTTPLRIILTDDGGTVRGWPTPPTREAIENYVGGYADQGVDVLSYGLLGAHMATYDSRVLYRECLDQPIDDSLVCRNTAIWWKTASICPPSSPPPATKMTYCSGRLCV